MTKDQMKKWIDNATYKQLLGHWRFAAVGDPFFSGEIGEYYAKVMGEKRKQDEAEHVCASKKLGW